MRTVKQQANYQALGVSMNLWSRNKKGASATGFGNSGKKKARRRLQTFRLESIKTPLVVFPFGGYESDPVSHFVDWLHLKFGILAGSACPVHPPVSPSPVPGVGGLLNIDDPFGLTAGGPRVDVPFDWGAGIGTLPPPFVVPIDPGVDSSKSPQVNPGDFPLANHPLIGIIDTGFSGNNSDINSSRVILGRDRVSNDDNPLLSAGEGNEHGTFVEGIIGASRNNGVGIDGINDRAPMWVGRAIGSGKWADSLREFVDAVKKSGQPNGLVNLSLDLTQQNPDGSVTTRYEFTPEERSALEYARQNHVLIVAAAGNDGGVMSVLGQASQEFDNIMTVGAADGKNRAAYSSYGRGLDILAAGGTPEKPEWSTVGDGVGTMAGTSVATAKVTGAASLVWAANPGLNYRQVVEILKSTAMDLSAPGWDEETGAGLLDMGAAVEKAKVTKPEVYNPEDFLTLTTGIRGGQVTPQERAVQVHQVQNPWGRRYYYGWLNNSNPMDRFDFTVTSTKLVQLSLKDAFNNDFLEAQVSLYDGNGNYYPLNQPDFNSSYRSVTLYPGNYQLQVDKGYRYEIDPYKLTLNFNENNNISVQDDSIWLPRPVISQPPVFTPPPSQPSVPIVIQPPPVDWQKIAEEQAKAELLKKQQAEAAAKAAAEASAKAAAEAAAKAAAEAEQRRRSEAEENARKAIALAYEQNKSWLGNSFNDVQIDWNTLLSSRVAAIQYFNGGYVVWNGIHAVAYQTGSGNSNSSTNLTPIQVRLHDLGMQYGRHEYGQYVGFVNRQDYYKFTVEKIGDYYPQDLLFALRSNGVDIPLTDASIEILDDQLNPVPLSQVWQPNGQPGSSNLTGTTYYVRVKPAKNNLNYGLTLNLDSAQESLGSARPLGAIKGRQQFRDFVGNKGDGLGDYYSFSVEHPSLLQYSLSQFDPGGDANVEILDSNGNVIPPDQFSGKVGGKELQPGQYYLRVTAANNTNTNYTLTMQMAEELGTYTGRHEYNDRVIAGKYREAFYRLKVDAPAEELHLALRNLSGDANVELLRNDGSGIVNSTLISPVSNQSGTQEEYKAYANVPPGDYLVRVYMPDSSVPWTKYDLVMNLDQAGEDWSRARNLGMLTDIAQSSDYQFSDFVGADKGDGSDVYKFQVGDYGLVHLALKPQAGDGEANMLAGNMRLQDESGKDVNLLNVNTGKDVNYAAAYLQPGKSYYLTVSSNREMMTNYNLVINPVSEETINGFRVSGDLYKVFAHYRESLGSPTSAVTNEFSGVSYQAFQNGLIVTSSYGSYPVWWGIKDAYLNKYGSLSGKLGAPTGIEYDWNGGQRQDFAGGYITWENGFTQAYKYDGSILFPPPAPDSYGSSGGPINTESEFIQRLYGHSKGQITQRPNSKHWAIDVVNQGSYPYKVYALAGGVIKFIGKDQYGGNYIDIWNEELKRTFRYIHFESFNPNLKKGQTINGGDYIGIEGYTGLTDPEGPEGRHTHVGVLLQNGVAENSWIAFGKIPTSSGGGGNSNTGNVSSPINAAPKTKFELAREAAIQRAGGSTVVGNLIGEPKYVKTNHGQGWFQEFNQNGQKRVLALQDGSDQAHWVPDFNYEEYMRLGGPYGELGLPTNEPQNFQARETGTPASWQAFSGWNGTARIYHSNGKPVATWGKIGEFYQRPDVGDANGWLGLPIKVDGHDLVEWDDPDGVTKWASFEKGRIQYNQKTGEMNAIPNVDKALEFIRQIEKENSSNSQAFVANLLRRHTRSNYNSSIFNLFAGEQDLFSNQGNELDYDPNSSQSIPKSKELYTAKGLIMNGKLIDFGHFIASLSYQLSHNPIFISAPEWTSWAGDIASSIEDIIFEKDTEKIKSKLNELAGEKDYVGDVAAFVIGEMIKSEKLSISEAINKFNSRPYKENVIQFLTKQFQANIQSNELKNPYDLEKKIRQSVFNFISTDIKNPVNSLLLPPQIINNEAFIIGSLHFMTYLLKNSGLNSPLRFKPYELNSILSTPSFLNYEVSVPL